MRRAVGLACALLILAAPALAGEPGIYVSPFIPDEVAQQDPKDGTVVMSVRVWTGKRWASQDIVIDPAGLPLECTALPAKPVT